MIRFFQIDLHQFFNMCHPVQEGTAVNEQFFCCFDSIHLAGQIGLQRLVILCLMLYIIFFQGQYCMTAYNIRLQTFGTFSQQIVKSDVLKTIDPPERVQPQSFFQCDLRLKIIRLQTIQPRKHIADTRFQITVL